MWGGWVVHEGGASGAETGCLGVQRSNRRVFSPVRVECSKATQRTPMAHAFSAELRGAALTRTWSNQIRRTPVRTV